MTDHTTREPDREVHTAGGSTVDDRGERRIERDPSSRHTETSDTAAMPPPPQSGPNSGGLLNDDDRAGYQRRWDDIQVRFVDEPRESVREADDLVGEVTRHIAERFTDARRDMEQRWESGEQPSTEELRQAVQRYRDFFQRLVSG